MKRFTVLAVSLLAVLSLGACDPEPITVCNKAAGAAHQCRDIQP